MFTSLLKIF